MRSPRFIASLICGIVVFAAGERSNATPRESLASLTPTPTLALASHEEIHDQAIAYLREQGANDRALSAADQLWNDVDRFPSADPLDRVARIIALADGRAQDLVDVCSAARQSVSLPNIEWLRSEDISPWARNHLRLYFGRWLAHERMYDEASEQLVNLQPEAVIDPATLLFYQGVVQHRLLERELALTTVRRLLNDVQDPPQRYVALAKLMEKDLDALEDESLDHISRRMEDVTRRLALGRAGKKVRDVEDGVVQSLDKMIEELEKKQQQQQQQSQSSGGGMPTQPMDDSRIAQQKGPGHVDAKDLGSEADWGNLPPKQREEAMQQIGKDFPSHYRDVVEQYFRKLASEGRVSLTDARLRLPPVALHDAMQFPVVPA